MRLRRCLPILVMFFGALAAVPSAGAKTVSGTLSKSGYTVVAVSTKGTTVTASMRGKAFSINARSRSMRQMTLHLIDRRGRYAGPVVVGRKGKRAIVGVRAGARLGTVRIKASHAIPAKRLAPRFVVRKRTAKARNGVPVGARGFGLVAGTKGKAGVFAMAARQGQPTNQPDSAIAGQDPDQDGVPNALDIDANGNGIIDMADPNAPRAAGFTVWENYLADLDETVNVSAVPGSEAQIDERMKSLLELVFVDVQPGTRLDCNGLSWCSPSGTGQIVPAGSAGDPNSAARVPFPACCDADADGFGLISGTSVSAGDGGEFRMWPTATSSEIRSGDVMIQRVPQADGTIREIPGALGFVFGTVPAIKSLTAASGTRTISYPVAAGGPGTMANPLPLPIADLDALTIEFWRPQRTAIAGAGEPAGYMDIGNLRYFIQLPDYPGARPPGPGENVQCRGDFLTPVSSALTRGPEGLVDSSADTPASAANTLAFTLNVRGCIEAKGGTITSGSRFRIHLEAMTPSGGDHVNQNLFLQIQ